MPLDMAHGRSFYFGIERVFEHFHFDEMGSVRLPEEPRSMLLCLDSGRIPFDQLKPLAQTLLDSGCVYFCCFGYAAKQMHDAIDWIRAEREMTAMECGGQRTEGEGRVIMTTWHDDEPLESVIEFWCRYGYPPAEWGPVRTWASVVIGDPMLHLTIQEIVETRELSDIERGRLPLRDD